MKIALVVGSAVATIKDDKLHGRKLLLVRKTDDSGNPSGSTRVAVDTVGAGKGDVVITVEGSAARRTFDTLDAPVDLAIVGIVDSLEVEGTVTFRKGP
ncbi:MAG: EutN/CcmL family microcompartment protein [Syntrophobacteraceae bacterium]|nr:EutN/CcmL family microcompartment protein [Desulfobacteraceae bacterium]